MHPNKGLKQAFRRQRTQAFLSRHQPLEAVHEPRTATPKVARGGRAPTRSSPPQEGELQVQAGDLGQAALPGPHRAGHLVRAQVHVRKWHPCAGSALLICCTRCLLPVLVRLGRSGIDGWEEQACAALLAEGLLRLTGGTLVCQPGKYRTCACGHATEADHASHAKHW